MPRPRKPTKLKILKGTFRKHRNNSADLDIKSDPPKAPTWLLPEAKKEFVRVLKLYKDKGVLTGLDGPLLAIYCQLWAKFIQGERGEAEPLIAAQVNQMRGIARSYGLDPQSRSRLGSKVAKSKNPYEDI